MATFNPSLGPAKGGGPSKFNPTLKGGGPFKPSLGGSYGELSPTMGGGIPKQPRLPMPTIPGNGNPGPLPPGTGSPRPQPFPNPRPPVGTDPWSNPFIPSPRDGNRLPKQPYPRNGGFPGMPRGGTPGPSGPIIDPRQLPGPRGGSGMLGNLQEIARRRLQRGL